MKEDADVHQLDGWDIAVIVIYFLFVLGVGIWSSKKNRSDSIQGYFLASKNMNWIPVGASLFASNIGSGHFIGLAGSGASSGIGVAGFELSAIFILMLLGYLFVPVYISSGIYTMPEYLRERFGGQRIRIYLSFLSLLLYIFTKISADLYAGAIFITQALNKSNSPEWLYLSILILLAMAALFTIAGGLTAVIWTDFVQTLIMVVGSFILMSSAFGAVGGFTVIQDQFPYAIAKKRSNTSCGLPPKDFMNLFRSAYPGESDLPWTGMTIGLAMNSIWYWCADQVIVQRTLSSQNLNHAKGGCIFASYLKLLPLWILVFPGMVARILFPNTVGCSHPDECKKICGSELGCTNIAYVELVIKLLPSGVAGLMLAVMMSALMSSLTSIFNSASTIFTIDIWKRFRKKANDIEMVIVGRTFVLILVVISIIWIPVIRSFSNSRLFDYIQAISSFLSPPITVVFLLAIFWPRTNEPGAFWGLMTGLSVGLIRFALEFLYPMPSCGSVGPDNRPQFIKSAVDNVHYLHFSIILFCLTCLVTVVITLLTEPIPEECLYRLTYWSRHSLAVRTPIEMNKKSIKKKKKRENDEKNAEDYSEIRGSNQPAETLSSCTICWYTFCGLRGKYVASTENNLAEAPTKEQEARRAVEFLYEDPMWKRFVDANALICISITVFFWGFFS